jgi:hypothetical protein
LIRIAATTGVFALAVALSPTAQAATTKLSTRDAARAIVKQAKRDGNRRVTVKECRRQNRRRVVCSVRVTKRNGDRALDRYVALRGRSGRIGITHRPFIPPPVGM